MLPDWQTHQVFLSDQLEPRFPELTGKLLRILEDRDIPCRLVSGTADIWIRDYAPVPVSDSSFAQFVYAPDYLRKDHQHLITPPQVFEGLVRNCASSPLIIDGGNIVTDGQTVLLTEKIFQENSDWKREEIRAELRTVLNVDRIITIPREPYDVIGHADGMVRFLEPGRVVMNDSRNIDPRFHERLRDILARHHLTIELLPYEPGGRKVNGIDSAVGNYANFLRVGNLVVLPAYGTATDDMVRQRLQKWLPKTDIVFFPCREIAEQGGVLNCVTWTISKNDRDRSEIPELL